MSTLDLLPLLADAWPAGPATLIFIAGAAVIGIAGTRLTAAADRLADRTGLGEAISGAAFLGCLTSLPGITASVTAAVDGRPRLAVSNALGGISAQTAFLALADIAYRRANLEHAAASLGNMLQAALLSSLLAAILVASGGPEMSVAGFHPLSVILPLAWLLGLRLIHGSRQRPMWLPRRTHDTWVDVPETEGARAPSTTALWLHLSTAGLVVVAAGWIVTRSAESLADTTGIDDTLAGAYLTAVATSLPELVTSIAAVRRGALTLAVGGIIGGNAFDTLFVAGADFAWSEGSIYHAISPREHLLLGLALLLNAVLLLGLLRREPQGPGGIGFESCLVLVLWVGGTALLVLG